MATKRTTQRCWPGYEPVPGKPQHSQGSCRPKADSKSTAAEKAFKKKRKAQIDRWEAAHPGSRRTAAQHLGKPGNARKRTRKAAETTGRRTRSAAATRTASGSAPTRRASKRTAPAATRKR